MIDSSEALGQDKFEVVTVNGETIVLQSDIKNFSAPLVQGVIGDTNGLQILTLGGTDAQEWNIETPVNGSVISTAMPTALASAPPVIEEENSSDSQFIGHIDEVRIQTTEDGTFLPATVNAKMADGTFKRLTLFPEIVNGSVRYMVHFENEEVATPNESELSSAIVQDTTSLSQKIDNLISQNEDIIGTSKKIRSTKRDKEQISNILRNAKHQRPRNIVRNRTMSLLKPNVPRMNNVHFPVKKTVDAGLSQFIKVNEKLINIPTSKQPIENSTETQQHNELFISLQKFLESQQLQLKDQPMKKFQLKVQLMESKDGLTKINDQSASKEAVINNSRPPPQPPPIVPSSSAVSTEEDEFADEIFIKTSPEYFVKKEKNDFPLGSTENPIQLLQAGQTFHSRQPLSEAQLRQISSILRKQKQNNSNNVEKNSIFDPKTNTRIVYRVVYPDDIETKSEFGDDDPIRGKRKGKRGRHKGKTTQEEVSTAEPTESGVNGEERHKADDNQEPRPPKVAKLPRTRSGRLSRPPRYMVRDYKRLQSDADLPAKSREEDWYMDYRTPDAEPPPGDNFLFFGEEAPRPRLRRNVKPEFRCPTCDKIYLGYGKMLWHLRKFPDHSNAEEYEELYQREHSYRKVRRINLVKLKQMLSGADRATLQGTFGPLLADAFTLWDFLLLRVSLLKRGGVDEVQGLLKELTLLFEKLGKIAEELLSPAFARDEDADGSYVDLVQHEIAYALGLPIGVYKVNADRIHLLRLQEEESPPPPPAPPRPTQLATKFEPNLSTKLLECSNDSIDLDCSSKDVEPEEEKKEWPVSEKVVDTNSEFLSEFLQSLPEESSANPLPSSENETMNLWKAPDDEVGNSSTPHLLPSSAHDEEISLWKAGKAVDEGGEDLGLWKEKDDSAWKASESHATATSTLWKASDAESPLSPWKSGDNEGGRSKVWKSNGVDALQTATAGKHIGTKDDSWKDGKSHSLPHTPAGNSLEGDLWKKETKGEIWEPGGEEKDKKDWLRLWKEETGGPGLRSARLTSTPESNGPALFSPPLRRNSVSSFAPSHQEELLSLDLHELFEDLIPDQSKPRRPKPNSIESIINEALFTGSEPPPTHPSLPPSLSIIPDSLDEVSNLDFLNQD